MDGVKIDYKKILEIVLIGIGCYWALNNFQIILDIFNSAKKELIIIDSYADKKILDIVKDLNIKIVIITKKNNLLKETTIKEYNKEYHNLTVKYDNTFHDRYFILDNEIVYHCGASIYRIGYKTFSITLIGDQEMINALINKIN